MRWLLGLVVLAVPAMVEAQEDAGSQPLADHPLRIAFEVRFASAPNDAVLWEPTVDLSYRPTPHVFAGVALGGGSVALVDGTRDAFNLQPHAGYAEMLGGWLEIYVRGGAALQLRGGAQIAGGSSFAPFAAMGARAWLGGCDGPTLAPDGAGLCVSLGYELRAQHQLAGGYLMMPAVLPEGSTTISSGLLFGVEL